MREYWVKNTRILHFEKYLFQEAREAWRSGSSQPKKRINRNFFSLGYYDQLSYVRADAEDTFDYKHCFLLKYPYACSRRPIIADQVFTLNDTEREITSEDPFEYKGASLRPFLGIILVTVSGKSDNTVCSENMYDDLTKQIKRVCDEFLNGLDTERFCCKYFYTPNCADFCIALRTDTLNIIYKLKQHISSCSVMLGDSSGIFHTISYTVIEPGAYIWPEYIIERNKEIEIEMRLSCTNDAVERLKNCLNEHAAGADGKICGITGAGQYAVEINFEAFSRIYPFLGAMKLDNPPEVIFSAPDGLQRCFAEKHMECSYIRAKYQPYAYEEYNRFSVDGRADEMIISKCRNQVNNLRNQIYAPTISLKNMIREKEIMLRELFNTYNDFWYRPCSWWKGVWFYAQLESIIDGINQQTDLIRKKTPKSWRVQDMTIAGKLTKQLCKDITRAVAAVNNFNKLLQSINQYVINVPNYEIQTKVNVEKYLMAYTMYLLKISVNYNRQVENKKRIIPFISLDLTTDGISAWTLFGVKEDIADTEASREDGLNGIEQTPFAITIPNYQWLANIYHVLPMITHEMSHNFRYMDRKKRNDFACEYILYYLSDYLLEKIMEPIMEYGSLFYGNLGDFLRKHIRKVLLTKLTEYLVSWKDMKFRDAGEYIRECFLEVTGIQDEEEYSRKIWNLIADDMTVLAKITAVDYLRVQDLANMEINTGNCWIISFNIVLDILNGEKDGNGKSRGLDWKMALEKVIAGYKNDSSEHDAVISNSLTMALEFLEAYEDTGEIAVTDIFAAAHTAIYYWKKDGIAAEMYENDENFKEAVDIVLKMEASPGLSFTLPEGEKNHLRVTEQMSRYEDLNRIWHCVGNIVTNITNKSKKIVSYKKSCADEFAGELYNRLHGNYLEMLDQRHNDENLWITFREEQKKLVSMGIVSSDRQQFVKFYRNVLSRIEIAKIKEIIEDHMQLYEELFADMGMCRAFGFTAYGYFMYSIHIFMKERDIPKKPINDFTRDRMKFLLVSIYADDIGMDSTWKCSLEGASFYQSLEDYWEDLRTALVSKHDLTEWKNLKSLTEHNHFLNINEEEILVVLNESDSMGENRLSGQETTHLEILRWMEALYEALDLENYSTDECREMLIRHIKASENGMEEFNHETGDGFQNGKTWFDICQEDSSVKDIGNYFNSYQFSMVQKSHREGRCLNYQNKFIDENYKKMFNCMHKIRCSIQNMHNKGEEWKILELLFKQDFSEGDQ